MEEKLKENLQNPSVWERGFFILLFAIVFHLVEVAAWSLVLFQFIVVLVTGRPHDRILKFGRLLAAYVNQILLYLTQNTDERPFPFADFPSEPELPG